MLDDLKPASKPDKSVPVKINITQTKKPDTTSFITPDQMASLEDVETIPADPTKTPIKSSDLKQKIIDNWKHRKREWLIGGGTVVLGGILIAVVVIHNTPKPVVSAAKPSVIIKKKVAPQPTTVPSTLSGLPVAPAVNQKVVTGVMVENSLQARPQSGLSQAGVVFEAIAEGGITRFMALFQDTSPGDVGPIRSARPYYAQWVQGFDAGYAHVGGSPEALANIREWGVRDLDQFANGGSYHRISSREAPHNVYTSIDALNQLETAKGFTSSNFKGFVRKAEAPSKQPTAKAINFAISGPAYNVHYDYNQPTNSYNRSEGGGAHLDATTNAVLSPKTVIALVMPYSLAGDGYHSQYNTIGSGPAYIFQDGAVIIGQWTKPDNATQFNFTDSAGKPLGLNPGQTWLTALRGTNEITYSP